MAATSQGVIEMGRCLLHAGLSLVPTVRCPLRREQAPSGRLIETPSSAEEGGLHAPT